MILRNRLRTTPGAGEAQKETAARRTTTAMMDGSGSASLASPGPERGHPGHRPIPRPSFPHSPVSRAAIGPCGPAWQYESVTSHTRILFLTVAAARVVTASDFVCNSARHPSSRHRPGLTLPQIERVLAKACWPIGRPTQPWALSSTTRGACGFQSQITLDSRLRVLAVTSSSKIHNPVFTNMFSIWTPSRASAEVG